MIKRPLFAAAVLAAVIIAVLYRADPYIFRPRIELQDQAEIYLRGTVLKINYKNDNVHVLLKKAFFSVMGDPELQKDTKAYEWENAGKAVLIMSEEKFILSGIKIGNVICADCIYQQFSKARNYGNFDEEQYYFSEGIFLKAKPESILITDDHVDHLRQAMYLLRQKMTYALYASVRDEETSSVMNAVCTGDRSGLSEETKSLYQTSGIAHVLAISGLHISLLGMGVYKILRKLLWFMPSAVISIFIMLCFCILSSGSPSAVRALIMFTVQMGSIGLGKSYDIRCSLSLAALIMLISDPMLITNAAFEMSFAAVLSVAVLYKCINDFYVFRCENRLRKNKPSKWFSSFLLSLGVTCGTLPLIMLNYYEIPLYSIALNLLVVPAMSMVLGSGIIASFMGMASTGLGRFFSGAGAYLIQMVRMVCRISQLLPGSTIVTGAPSQIRVFIYYMMLLSASLTMGMYVRYKRHITNMKFSGSGRNPVPGKIPSGHSAIKAACICAFAGLCLLILFGREKQSQLTISMLDAGQGECILIENPSGSVYMIDAGSTSIENAAKYRISGAVRYKGISQIDYVIVTHPDKDHISAVIELLESGDDQHISIGHILTPSFPENENYKKLVRYAEEKDVPVTDLCEGMKINEGELQLLCIHPEKNKRSESINDDSAVIDLRYGEFCALFTGDLEEQGEKNIMPYLKSEALRLSGYDLLKIAHHGSAGSSGIEFLKLVSPDVSIISAGVGNVYGHPHQQTLEKLKECGSLVFCTKECGETDIMADMSGIRKVRTKLPGG